MTLTEPQRDLRWQMEVVAYRCLHAVTYFDGVTGHGQDFWNFTQNCFGETACLLWCHLFNHRSNDPVHYSKLFGDDRLMPLGQRFKYDAVLTRLQCAADIPENEYKQFREVVVKFRNKYVSHRDYHSDSVIFPDLGKIAAMCSEFRVVLEETVREELKHNPDDIDLSKLQRYYSEHQNNLILIQCSREVQRAVTNAA